MFIADSSPYLSCHVLPQSCQVRFLPPVLLSTVKSCYLSCLIFYSLVFLISGLAAFSVLALLFVWNKPCFLKFRIWVLPLHHASWHFLPLDIISTKKFNTIQHNTSYNTIHCNTILITSNELKSKWVQFTHYQLKKCVFIAEYHQHSNGNLCHAV